MSSVVGHPFNRPRRESLDSGQSRDREQLKKKLIEERRHSEIPGIFGSFQKDFASDFVKYKRNLIRERQI